MSGKVNRSVIGFRYEAVSEWGRKRECYIVVAATTVEKVGVRVVIFDRISL